MTIKSIHLTNFQAHEDLALELSPGVNVILGPSDVGKSAIIRAIRWVTFNRPAGDAFIRDGCKDTEVTLGVAPDQTVTRAKGTKGNTYHVNDAELKAFGSNVPADVSTVLNLSEINFQGQHDPPFWFSETAGEVSRQLNQIVNLDLIDSTLANLASTVRANRAEANVVAERLADAKTERQDLRHVLEMDRDLKAVEELQTDFAVIVQQRVYLTDRVQKVRIHAQHSERTASALTTGKKTQVKGIVWKSCVERLVSLRSLVESAKSHATVAEREIPDIAHLDGLCHSWIDARQKQRSLDVMVFSLRKSAATVLKLKADLTSATKNFQEKMGDTCPLCEQPIK